MATDEEKSSALEEARRESSSVNNDDKTSAETVGSSKKTSGNSNSNISSTINTARKMTTPMGFFSLLTKVSIFEDLPFAVAYAAAIIKDSSDLIFGPTVILPMLSSILCSIVIFMMMTYAGFSGKGKKASSFLKGFFLVGGGMIDAVPGLAFFPIETATVTIIYMLTLSDRANEKK